MINKFFTVVLSLSFLILGKYSTNDPFIKDVSFSVVEDEVQVQFYLAEAFEKDFDKIFSSGKQINVCFEVLLKRKKLDAIKKKFKHSVSFDPLDQVYSIYFEEENETYSTEDWNEFITLLSTINCSFNVPERGDYKLKIESYLEKISIKNKNNEFDLMALWKFKKPKFSGHIQILGGGR